MKTLMPTTMTMPTETVENTAAPRLTGDDDPIGPRVARGWLWFWAAAVTLVYALLWSPNWYPLSDSSLYLSLGRSIAAGRGLTMMGDTIKLTPPLAPLLLAGVMKLGGGMGAIQAVMTGLMLLSHALCFLALRRIVGERLALAATLGGALSYWVFANAFTVMSEPPSMAMMWAGAWVLTGVRSGAPAPWGRVLGACLLLLGAAAARDAVVALTPGFILLLPGATRPGLKFGAVVVALSVSATGAWVVWETRRGKMPAWAWTAALLIPLGIALVAWGWRRRARVEGILDRLRVPLTRPEAWGHLAMFVVLTGAWLLVYRYPPKVLFGTRVAQGTTMPTTGPAFIPGTNEPMTMMTPTGPITVAEGDDDDASREGRYKAAFLWGVPRDARHLLTEPPVLGGRWVTEGLVMASVAVFETKSKPLAAVGTVVALVALTLTVVGLVMMLRAGHWWLLGAVVYFLVIWLQWGMRIKPRYMIPIAPILFMLLWAGLVTVTSWGRVWRQGRGPAQTRLGWGLAVALVALVALGNAFPWWVEFRVRHLNGGRDFYDVARRGAFSELVDIGAWAQKNIGPREAIWMNAGAQRRIAYFLTGRRIETRELRARTWAEFVSAPGATPKYAKPLRSFRRTIPPQDRFILAYVEQPLAGVTWPGWHLPLTPWRERPNWWRLYTRRPDGQWVQVQVPRGDRSYVSRVPVAGL